MRKESYEYYDFIKRHVDGEIKNTHTEYADMNADGKVDLTDAKLISEFMVEIHENTLPFKPIK